MPFRQRSGAAEIRDGRDPGSFHRTQFIEMSRQIKEGSKYLIEPMTLNYLNAFSGIPSPLSANRLKYSGTSFPQREST